MVLKLWQIQTILFICLGLIFLACLAKSAILMVIFFIFGMIMEIIYIKTTGGTKKWY